MWSANGCRLAAVACDTAERAVALPRRKNVNRLPAKPLKRRAKRLKFESMMISS